MTTLSSLLAPMKERLAKATKGPWKSDLGNWQIESENNDCYRDGICCFTPNDRDGLNGEYNPVNPIDDAEFIAHSRTDLEKLIAAVERMEWSLVNYSNLLGMGKMANEALDEARKILEGE